MRYPPEVLQTYVVDHNGKVHQLSPHKVEGYLYLRRGNNYKGHVKREIQQKLVFGTWRHPNEHELSRFIKEDNKVIEHITRLILKRVILTTLLIEVDDDLIPHFADDNRSRNLLKKSQDHLNRKNGQLFHKVFNQDEELLQSMMKAIDGALDVLSSRTPEQLWKIAELITRADEKELELAEAKYNESLTITKIENNDRDARNVGNGSESKQAASQNAGQQPADTQGAKTV